MTNTRLWELSEEIRQLEETIATIAEDETLREEKKKYNCNNSSPNGWKQENILKQKPLN
jgi:hypothetical protein